MKIYQIWEKIRNESRDVQDMVLATLEPQLNVRYNQIIEQELKKLGDLDEILPKYIKSRFTLSRVSDKEWHERGYDIWLYPDLYRKLSLAVKDIAIDTFVYRNGGKLPDDIVIVPRLSDDVSSEDFHELVCLTSYIMHRVYESELIDIEDSTLTNLKKLP